MTGKMMSISKIDTAADKSVSKFLRAGPIGIEFSQCTLSVNDKLANNTSKGAQCYAGVISKRLQLGGNH